MPRLRLALLPCPCPLMLIACTGAHSLIAQRPSFDAASPCATVEVLTADTVLTAPGDPTRLVAVLRDGSGALVERAVTWTSDADAVAAVETSGVVTTAAAGTATLVWAGKDETVATVVDGTVSVRFSARRREGKSRVSSDLGPRSA